MVEAAIFHGSAAELHAMAMPTDGDLAELWVMRASAPALVMGSSQKRELFDAQQLVADGVALAERRSGGGAVFIEPASTVWIDVVAPRSSGLWSSELVENFLIVGRVWKQAFATFGVELDLCVTAPERSDASGLACWAGVGWGELTMRNAQDDAVKVVGLSQRRTRWGSRVQAMAVLDESSARVAEYLGADNGALVAASIPTNHATVLADAGITALSLEAAVLGAFGHI